MSQPYRFRYASEIAGGFMLLCIGLLIAGIYLAGHAQGWFQKKLVLKARFEAGKGTYGLQEGADVRILGTLAGRVGEIVPSGEIGMETKFILLAKFKKFVRTDSIAKVKKKFEVGDAFVDITLGTPEKPMLNSGDQIECVQDEELVEAARKMLSEFRAILSHANVLTGQLEKREGVAGKLIGDPQWAADAQDIVRDIRQTTSQLPLMTARLDGLLTNVQAMVASLKDSAAGLPKVVDGAACIVQDVKGVSGGLTGQVAVVQSVLTQAQTTLRQTQVLVEAIQKHWLIRSYIHDDSGLEMELPLPAADERRTP